MSQEQQDAAGGIELARRALIAKADGDDNDVLTILNTASEGEAKYAAAMLLSCVWESFLREENDHHVRAASRLRKAATRLEEYGVLTQVALIVNDAERGL